MPNQDAPPQTVYLVDYVPIDKGNFKGQIKRKQIMHFFILVLNEYDA